MMNQKTCTLKIRLSPQEKKELAAAAKEANMNMSQFILERTIHAPIHIPYYTQTTHDFILGLEQVRYQMKDIDKTLALDEMLKLIDKEIAYLWRLLNTQ